MLSHNTDNTDVADLAVQRKKGMSEYNNNNNIIPGWKLSLSLTHTVSSGLAKDQRPWSWQGFSILLSDILAWWMVADTGFKPFFAAEGQNLQLLLHMVTSMLLLGQNLNWMLTQTCQSVKPQNHSNQNRQIHALLPMLLCPKKCNFWQVFQKNRLSSTWKRGAKCPASMVAGFKTTCHRKAGSIQQPLNCPVYVNPSRKCHKANLQRALQNYSRKDPGSRDMSAPWKSSLSWQGRNLRIQTSCHNIQIKHCLWQRLCEPEQWLSHSRLHCQTSLWHRGSAEASEAG